VGNPSDPGDGGSRPGTLDDGFNVIAKDLDRAFCLGLSANQAVIMNSVREQSWTAALVARRKGEPRPDPRPARVNLTHLADGSGLNRSRLSTALKGLVAGGILARSDDGYLIRKDYSKWLDDDGKARRFTTSQLTYIRAAKARAKPPQIAENSTPLPLQNATVEAELIDEISNRLLLQNATVDPETAVANCNSDDPSLLQNATATVAKRNSYCCKTQQRDTVLERTAEDFLDSEISPSLSPAGEDRPDTRDRSRSPNVRTPDDLALVREAMQVLASHPNSEHLAHRVGQEHNTPTNIGLVGWRWVVAAHKAFKRSDGNARAVSWDYFLGIVRKAGKDEYDDILAAPDPDPATPAANRPLSRKPTPAERRKADSEAIRLAVSQLDPDEEP
jgi:hypothetical protein